MPKCHRQLSAAASWVKIGRQAWLSELAKENLPGKDFVLRAPNHTKTAFQDRIADFYDAQAALRALLVAGGMPIQEAMKFSCHSWRHLYPTAGKQLDLTQTTLTPWADGRRAQVCQPCKIAKPASRSLFRKQGS